MLGQWLEAFLFDISASIVTEVFLWLLVGIFSCAALLIRIDHGYRFTRDAPTLLTSIGILGTFVGIVVGLLHFDPQDIDASIPALLAGLKTAFITSLAGMGGAILFKVLSTTPILAARQRHEAASAAGPEDILNALLDQREGLISLHSAIAGNEETSVIGQFMLSRQAQADQGTETRKAIADLKNTISGTAAGSLVGQLTLMRDEQTQRHRDLMQARDEDRAQLDSLAEKLWKELEEFAEMLSKSASEQVINALKEVIADFNRNLTEQFGENFKALDASVQKLVEWQENYRVQIEQMVKQYALGVQAITQTESSVAQISQESQQIPAAMEKLKTVMVTNQHQIDELSNHLDAFREMRLKAEEAVPEIRKQVQKTVDDVADSVKIASDHYTKLLELSDAYLEAHDQKTQELLDRFVKTTADGIDKVRDGLETGATATKTAIIAGAEEFTNNVDRIKSNLTSTSDQIAIQSDQIRHQLEDTFREVNSHVRAIASTLSEESAGLSSTLKTTGEQVMRDTQTTQRQVADSIEQMQKRLESVLDEVVAAQTRSMDRTVQALENHMREAIAKTGDGVNAQLSAIDQAMQKEVQSVMNEMGQALGKITGRFTEDYTKLVGAMQQIVSQDGQSQRLRNN